MTRRTYLPLYIIWIVTLLLVPLGGQVPTVHAATQTSQIDAMLVIDVSNSMNTSDVNKIGNEAMKMFIDMLSAQGDKVGIVAYTDKIEREKALLTIESSSDKEDLKQFIDELNRGAYTDIAVGVREAVKVLEQGADPAHEPMIVLLADGNNYLNDESDRTQAESDQELNQAVEAAKQKGIPIYTIGLNADGQLNEAALAELADKTGGKSFATKSAEDLPQILSEIFASHLKLNIVPVQSLTGNGSYQEVIVNVPNANVVEANISIMSSKPVEVRLTDPNGNSVAVPSDEVLLSTSKSYSLVKLLQPMEGDWKLEVKGVSQDKIDINLVFNYDLELAMDAIPTKTYSKGDKIDLQSYLVSNGQKLQDQELYQNMNAVLVVKDMDTGHTSEVKLNNMGDHFAGSYTIADAHDYELTVRAEEQSFYRETQPVKISAKPGAAGSGSSMSDQPKDESSTPMWIYIAGGVGVLAVAAAAYFILTAVKKANRGFVGQMIIEIRDDNTGEKTHPQYKKLNAFRGKFNLHQLLQLAPELKETEMILFTPGNQDRIVLKNLSACTIEKSGRAMDASKGVELKGGERLTVPLTNVDKTIMIEYLK